MKNNAMLFAVMVAGLMACSKDPAVPANLTNNPLVSPFDKEVDAVVQKYLPKVNTVGLAVGIWKDGESHVYGYGEVQKGSGIIPDAHTFFEIGSITKTFTAAATVQMLQEKGLGVDQPIRSFLPSDIGPLAKGGVEIAFKHLLNHSSGLPYFPSNFNLLLANPAKAFRNYSENDMYEFLKKGKLNATPGTSYEYSNTALGVAGLILARAYQQPYGEVIQQKVCGQLGLFETKAVLNASEKSRMSKGHKGAKETDWWESLGAFDGAGVLKSTPSDLLKYGAAVANPPDAPLGDAMRLCQNPTFQDPKNLDSRIWICLGWVEIPDPVGGGTLLFHDGGTGGFNTLIVVDKTNKKVLTLFFNSFDESSDTESETRLAFQKELLDLF
jgi:CubicO group peptidase (beta-lactamase class C family)